MIKTLLALPILLTLIFTGCSHSAPYYPPPPPPAYSSFAQEGYRDGIAAANRDIRRGLPPDPGRHPRFRRPPVPPPAIGDYRQGFRVGYDQVFHHGAPPPGGF